MIISTTRRRAVKPPTAVSDREEFDCYSLDRVFESDTLVSLLPAKIVSGSGNRRHAALEEAQNPLLAVRGCFSDEPLRFGTINVNHARLE
jgi:hypothetical protein